MRKRAEQVDATRLRITEAAVRLHTTVGPANTTISAVAEEAGVTRVTVYRHFADEEQLFAACSAHWAQLHPPPSPVQWQTLAAVEPRARYALHELYRWYAENADALGLFARDSHAMPQAMQEQMRTMPMQMAAALLVGSGVRGHDRRRLQAVAGHVVSLSTWQSLVVEQGLTHDAAVDVALGFLLGTHDGVLSRES